MKKSTLLLVAVLLLASQLAAQTYVIPFASTWRYLDNGSNQGTAWRAVSFADGAWKTGNGKFGYGYHNEGTLINYGPDPDNKYITTYFRKAITIADVSTFSSFTGRALRDDGLVVYVNGVEVYRSNMPTGTIAYTTLASSASDNGTTPQSFTIKPSAFVSGTNVIAVEVHQTGRDSFDLVFDLELSGTGGTTTGDQTPPTMLSLNRQSPTTEATTATTVIFRATFSEAVKGVDVTDFQRLGTASGTISSLAVVGTSATTYDVTVKSISGSGTLGLGLKSSGTNITDLAGNPISGGFTGQSYTIGQITATVGFSSITTLQQVAAIPEATKGMGQAKVFTNAGRQWAVFANSAGTHLWRLDATSWTRILTLTTEGSRADCIVDGNVTHILLYDGKESEFVSVEYVAASNTYQLWSKRKTKLNILLESGVETASMALDGNGRLWLASDVVSDIHVRWSDPPYSQWSSPMKIATGISDDDIAALIYMPAFRKIGLLWSNQKADRFGFRTHSDGQAPATWSAIEVPASQSALNVGGGMADDHLSMKVAQDGTLYCAVKTSYDDSDYPKIALLVRRPSGSWDNLYDVSRRGTVPGIILNEAIGRIRVMYTSQTYGGDILFKESSTSKIAFGKELILIRGVNNYASSSHQNFQSEVVVLASNSNYTVGVLARDGSSSSPPPSIAAPLANLAAPAGAAAAQVTLLAFPNPFSANATIRFSLPQEGEYELTLYDGKQAHKVFYQRGRARAGELNSIDVDGSGLARGFYLARLQTKSTTQNLRLVHDR
jgi:hypothetical protein